MEENKKEKSENVKENSEEKKSSDKILLIGVLTIIFLFVIVFGLSLLFKSQPPKTIEELHILNIGGKLKPEQGYLYKGVYSFINLDDFWYTQLTSPSGKKLYNMNFRYSPRDLEDVTIYGYLNTSSFNDAKNYYPTFNPTEKEEDLSKVALAIGDFNTHMTKAFNKFPIAACDRNETDACMDRPIITCENRDKIVLYIKVANESQIIYDNNCIIVQGSGFDLVKGVDRILFKFYGLMD